MTPSFVGSPVFNAIVAGAKFLQRYQATNFVARTFQGAGNIISGSAQYVIGHAFKWSKNEQLYKVQSPLHIERGARVFRQGLHEFAPGAAGAVAAALIYMGVSASLRNK